MESILARALEYTLKYWLKSFSRDQFKLQGRTAQLSNLDINGDALHASVGLPPALNVAKAKVGKLQITLPPVSYVQVEPIVVQIDKLYLVLEEKSDLDICVNSSSGRTSTSSGKGSGYGFADKIADGMTLEVGTVNLLVETRGGSRRQGGAAWAPPLASITIRNLLLYTTNENWQVVNLKEARDFSSDNKCIYVFKKLEWESLSIDLLPHPDMFTDAHLTCSEDERNTRDDDGAKRVFFGGERFLEGISGQAYITVQRTELNSPLGLEVRFHITEAVCPALSEPGLRALLRCMTGLFVCLNRGDVDPKAQESTEAAGRSLVSVIVDHIFLCIKDAEFQLELLMQSLFFSRASISDRENTKNLSHIMIGGLFLRDTFSHPPCTLVQPSMQAITRDSLHIPEFGKDFCPPIYPLGDKHWKVDEGVPLIVLYSLQINPTPAPPYLASQTVIDCQPLLINLQEESCLRICSFLADGVVVNHGAVLPDYSVNSIVFTLKELDLTIPLDTEESEDPAMNGNAALSSFAGARLHIENLFYSESPVVKLRLLNLDKDPACFCLWEDQPVDSSQKKWITQASNISLSLETCCSIKGRRSFRNWSTGLWKCVELNDACIEAAMATADGSPLINVPPPGGIVRVGVSCQQYLSNTSVEQLFFVLDLYAYFGRVIEKIGKVRDGNQQKKNREEILGRRLMEKVPSDTAISLAVKDLQLRFLETDFINIQGMPLVKFIGGDLFIKVSHRALGGAIAVSSSVHWNSIRVDCVDAEGNLTHENGMMKTPIEPGLLMAGNRYPQMRAVFWVDEKFKQQPNGLAVPFLDISMVHVMPYDARDMECQSLTVSAKVAGVRLGGGMNYTEALLHRFGILGPDGGPGEGLSKGLKNLSTGPLSKLFRASTLIMDNQKENGSSEDGEYVGLLDLEKPDNVDVSIELIDWLFALEGAQEMAERWWFPTHEDVSREARCWHTSFQILQVKAKSGPKNVLNGTRKAHRTQAYPVELVTVGVEGLRALKPQARKDIVQVGVPSKGFQETIGNSGGINLEVRMVISEADDNAEMVNWIVENLKFSVRQPIEAVATKDELQHLAFLCKSEVDSMGRIAAGILRVLKLEESIGQAAIDQLSNLGTEGLDRIFTPEKLSRRGSAGSIASSPNVIGENPRQSLESTVSSLEAEVEDCQEKFSALVTEPSSSEFSTEHLAHIEQLRQNFEHLQVLLTRLRTQL